MPAEQHFEIGCSPDRAFDGFTDQDEIVAWWGAPDIYKTVSWTADLREGGRWQAEFEAPDRTRFGASGAYLSIDRPARLEWTWKADWEPEVEKTIQMRFTPSPVGTMMVVQTRGHRSAEARSLDEAAWAMIVGWFSRAVSERDE